MVKVIFACVHNAGRSQMAAAFFNQLADRSKAEAVSAGTEPGLRVHPEVLAAMQEIGIDLSSAKPQKLTDLCCVQLKRMIFIHAKKGTEEQLFIDRHGTFRRHENSSTGVDHDEVKADRLGAALLMPRGFVQQETEIHDLNLDEGKRSTTSRSGFR